MNMGPIAVVGAGGHAKVVVSTLLACGMKVGGVLDDDSSKQGTHLLGVPVLGPISMLSTLGCAGAVLGIGDNRIRQRLASAFAVEWVSVVHPAAWVDPSVKIGPGTVVFAHVAIQPDTVIGRHAIINTGATVDHDCAIGDFAHVAPGVNLSGGVTVGEGALLGVGSVVIPLGRVGAWSTVGAGGVVLGEVEPGATAMGVPASVRGRRKR